MDEWLFFQLNRWAGYGYWMDYVAWLETKFGLLVQVMVLLLLWVLGGPRQHEARRTVILALVAAIFAVGLGQLPPQVWFRPRPFFELPAAFSLVDVGPSPAFPSIHAAVGYAVATIVGWGAPRRGAVVWFLALLLSFTRVYAGIHYPSDILAGLVLGVLIGLCLQALRPDLAPALDRVIAVLTPWEKQRD